MKVTLLQRDIIWESPAENTERLGISLLSLPKSDLYVLPEMFSTGFVAEPAGKTELEEGETLQWMRLTAKKLDAAIAGSVAVSSASGCYNRFYFVKPDGSEVHYDKHHLFTYGGENKRYTAGNDRVIIDYRGVRPQVSALVAQPRRLRLPFGCCQLADSTFKRMEHSAACKGYREPVLCVRCEPCRERSGL